MSLNSVINEKTIKSRYALLSNYLKDNNIGDLSESEIVYFKHIFEIYYTPDEEYTKFNIDTILNVTIVKNSYGKKCFTIYVDDTWYPTSIKRLSGSNRTEKANLIRSLRNAIEPQIKHFRICNPLNPKDICPITNGDLGTDAEVDHQIPFHILADEWLTKKTNVSYIYNIETFNYILQEPHYEKWSSFHLEKAILRWVSKEGNKTAHKLYSV